MLTINQHSHYLRYPEDVSRDYSRDMLKAWIADLAKRMAPAVIARAKAEYAQTPYFYLAPFDEQAFDAEGWIDQQLHDATFPAWKEME